MTIGVVRTMDAIAAFPVTLFIGIAAGPEPLQSESELLRITGSAATDDHRAGIPRQYVLLDAGRSNAPSPRFLTSIDVASPLDATECLDRVERAIESVSSGPGAEFERTWSATYRHIVDTEPTVETPYAIYLVGVDPPSGLDLDELEAFNDFYTNVHMPEVVARRRCLRATRFELVGELSPTRCPRFLVAYEVDEKAAAHRRHIGGAYSPGPEVWRRHTTPWRLWYRFLE